MRMMQAWEPDEFGEDRKDRGEALQKLSSVEEGAAETQHMVGGWDSCLGVAQKGVHCLQRGPKQ